MNETRIADKEKGPTATRIFDEELTNILKKIILDHWKITDEKNNFFPAPQPVSLERRDILKLSYYEYLVCAKSDGMRFLLICYDGNSYMTDRAFKFYKVKLVFNDKLYINGKLGGIFDGELVLNKKNVWQYVLHDCINIQNNDVSMNIFPDRYSEINRLINDIWVEKESEFKITEKLFFTFDQLYILNNLINENKLDHKTDGIIFTPRNKRVGIHTQYDLFKWKPRNLHTFDFKIVKNNNGIIAYANKNGAHIPYAHAVSGSIEEKIFIESLDKNCPDFTNNCIVECDFDNNLYKPIKLRLDKIHPNSFFTIQKTLVNIKENITIEELIQLTKKT